MTISSATRKAGPYLGDGVTTSFPFSFKVFKKEDVAVTFTSTSGADAELLLDSDYSVDLNIDQDNNPGGRVIYPRVGSPIATMQSGEKLTLTGGLAYTQPTDLPNLSPWFPEVVEDALDRAEIQIQQVKEITDRSIKISVSDTPLTPLPTASARANTVIGFDAVGNVTVLPLPSSLGAGDRIPFTLTAGVDFVAGVDTQVTLPRAPGSPGNLEVNFDGVPQEFGEWIVSGVVLTFNQPIPAFVTEVWGYIGTTLSTQIPPPGSVTDETVVVVPSSPGGVTTTQYEKNLERVSAFAFFTQEQKDALRAGTLAEDVTAALQIAIDAVCGAGKMLVLPDGFYSADALTIDARNGGGICAENPGGVVFLPRSNGVTSLTVSNQQLGAPRRPFYIRGIGFNSNSKTGHVCISSTNSLQLNVLDCWSYQVDYVIKVIAPNGGPNAYAVNIDGWNQYGRGSWDFDGQGTARVFQINIANVNQFSVGASGWVAPWFRFRRVINANMVNVVSQSLDGEAAGIVGLGAIEGLFLSNVLVVWPTDGITLAQDGDVKPPSYIYLNNVAVDQEAGIGINVGAEVFKAVNTNVTGGLFRTNTGPAWVIQNYTRDWIMIGCTIRDNYRSGLTVNNGCADGMVIGCVLRDNVALPASGFDLDIGITAHNDPILIGNRIDTQSVAGPQYINDGYSSDYLYADRAQAATIANTVETTLASYTLPANAFQGSMSLELETSGVLGANANNKTIKLYIAGVQVAAIATNGNGIGWRMEAKVYRISLTQAWAQITTYAGSTVNVSSAIIALDSTVNTGFQLTGQNGTASANDIVKHHFDVKRIR